MGGGDLNSKKSWHPNTIKNQERVWKAEKAAAEEKKKIAELQQERTQERDRAGLNELANQNFGTATDSRLSWMYNKPDAKGQQEEYLLGKTIDPNYERAGKSEQDAIPAVSRRVVGSSMLATPNDTQVDLVRKLREDPLLLVKERERAARAALLNNPLQRKRLTELLRKEQEQRKEMKIKSKKKNELDDKLAEKLNALSGQKGVNLAALLASDDSSSDSSNTEEEKSKKKKKKKSKKSKKKRKRTHSDEDSCSGNESHQKHAKISIKEKESEKTKHRSYKDNSSDKTEVKRKRQDRYATPDRSSSTIKFRERSKERTDHENSRLHDPDRGRESRTRPDVRKSDGHNSTSYERRAEGRSCPVYERKKERFNSSSNEKSRGRNPAKEKGLSSAERAARLAEMSVAGLEHEAARAARVSAQLAAARREDAEPPRPRRVAAHALPASLETRIHSNRHYIQRNERHMNENFARR